MKLADFDFELPEELIAQTPSPNRADSRLMVVNRERQTIEHHHFPNFPDYVADHNPLIVMNNTKVLPAKLSGRLAGREKPVEMILVEETTRATWLALVKGLARFKPGMEIHFGESADSLKAVFLASDKGLGTFRFECEGDLAETLDRLGLPPLPPYIKRLDRDRERDLMDRERYQTLYASEPGAIAAPTAGLHFTNELLEKLKDSTVFVTHHVGVGTFQPVRIDTVEEHKMGREYYKVPADTWNAIVQAKQGSRKILAVGTTTTRALESLTIEDLTHRAVSGWSETFIYPGHRFKNIDQLLTNFHLPRSTLFLLVCAFAGKHLMERAYQEAIEQRYRFFSYGDAMLIL